MSVTTAAARAKSGVQAGVVVAQTRMVPGFIWSKSSTVWITLAGAVFLSVIALTPQLVSRGMGIDMIVSTFLGGTGILIVVGVALDLDDKIESQLLVRQYEGFVRGSGETGGPARST